MSSINEQLVPPPKPRLSPLEFRNTDLVSRLLAATPPYLYNMSLLPNTYFFSEMLRSFVQAKSDPSNRPFPTRRTRKRPWTAMKSDTSSPPKLDPSNDWSLKSSYTERKPESPLELTVESDKPKSTFTSTLADRKVEMGLPEQAESLYSPMGQEASPSGLILPPPPPMWYPPLYPTTAPYGIDPLHFFIDLRVSGHIYDRKNQREETAKAESEEKKNGGRETAFRQSRHASAFSVPTPRPSRNTPMNLSHSEDYGEFSHESKNVRFDVKSMGLDKNKTGTSYIMTNISNIYKSVAEENQQKVKNEGSENGSTNENDNETEEERQKRVKDLRALIGLELVVDYMNHAKPQPKRPVEDTTFTDSESAGSPTLEVVAIHDET